ncbi:thiol methyltransferase [Diplocarpon rosae]|nr:thiol methyltransferase [Diplocarpon rosae]
MSSSLSDQPTDARARLLSHFTGVTGSTAHGTKWDELWNEGFLPWDRGFPNPALEDLLSAPGDLVPISSARIQSSQSESQSQSQSRSKKKKALVPGCGRGYDVLLLSAFGYDAYGLEFSAKALEEARKLEKGMAGKERYATRKGVEEKGAITWLAGDFFLDGFLESVGGDDAKFDLIYDYTFLSALPPTTRPAWSERVVELLAPEGRLVCIEFPTYKPPSSGGPPWALPPHVYLAHLSRPGEQVPYTEDGVLDESKLGNPSKTGLVRAEHFQPKRTHQIGYDVEGKVTDWVSIWTHPS